MLKYEVITTRSSVLRRGNVNLRYDRAIILLMAVRLARHTVRENVCNKAKNVNVTFFLILKKKRKRR